MTGDGEPQLHQQIGELLQGQKDMARRIKRVENEQCAAREALEEFREDISKKVQQNSDKLTFWRAVRIVVAGLFTAIVGAVAAIKGLSLNGR